MSICALHVCSAHEGQKRKLNPVKMGLQRVVSDCVPGAPTDRESDNVTDIGGLWASTQGHPHALSIFFPAWSPGG